MCGGTSARAAVTASGAGRVCDERSVVRFAPLGCIKGPSGVGNTEIPAKERKVLPMRSDILAITSAVSLLTAVSAFAQESFIWTHNADREQIRHFEVTPLGTLFVSTDDGVATLDQATGEVIWSRRDIKGCEPKESTQCNFLGKKNTTFSTIQIRTSAFFRWVVFESLMHGNALRWKGMPSSTSKPAPPFGTLSTSPSRKQGFSVHSVVGPIHAGWRSKG